MPAPVRWWALEMARRTTSVRSVLVGRVRVRVGGREDRQFHSIFVRREEREAKENRNRKQKTENKTGQHSRK